VKTCFRLFGGAIPGATLLAAVRGTSAASCNLVDLGAQVTALSILLLPLRKREKVRRVLGVKNTLTLMLAFLSFDVFAYVTPYQAAGNISVSSFSMQATDAGLYALQDFSGFAKAVIGSNDAGMPFVDVNATATDTYDGYTSASGALTYSWMVSTSDPTERSSVLVHVSTSGEIDGSYGYDPKPDVNGLLPNITSIGAHVYFGTQLESGYDQREFGLESGGVNFGVQKVYFDMAATQETGAPYVFQAAFLNSFDLLAVTNVENVIQMYAGAGINTTDGSNWVRSMAREFYSMRAFVDPSIQIDPSYADRVRLEISYIPAVAVPEPGSMALGLAGCVLACAAIRRRPGAQA
jgi:hypothetical protein